MNTVNNKRRKATKEKIERIFTELIQTKEISEIAVTDICQRAEINRSTFYANYLDIYDLADKIRDNLVAEVNSFYENDMENNCAFDYIKLFRHMKENRIFYLTYFKLGYDSKYTVDFSNISIKPPFMPEDNLDYHIEFHKAGLNAIIKKWLDSGCREEPETMVKIIEDEYRGRRLN